MMAFTDFSKPIATCVAADCTECPVKTDVHCHFRPHDLIHFLLISLPGLLIGGAGILTSDIMLLVLWIAILAGFFGLLEIRVLCSHCPHYSEKASNLRCWANFGAPKLWAYRPGPMSSYEKFLFFIGLAVVWGFPLPFFVIGGRWFLLVLFVLSSAGFFMTLKLLFCSRCMNFACPLNSVTKATRDLFFQRNPSVAEHWLGKY